MRRAGLTTTPHVAYPTPVNRHRLYLMIEAAFTCALLLGATLSCASVAKHNAEKDAAKARQTTEALLADLDKQLLWPKCEIPPRPGPCGLETDRWLERESLTRFIRETCHADPSAPADDACKAKFQTAAMDAVRARANLAKRQDVDNYCRTSPTECATIGNEELLYMRAHNAVLFARADDLVKAYNAKQAETEARARLQAEAAAAFGDGLKAAADAYAHPNSTQVTSDCTTRDNGFNCVQTIRR